MHVCEMKSCATNTVMMQPRPPREGAMVSYSSLPGRSFFCVSTVVSTDRRSFVKMRESASRYVVHNCCPARED